MDHPNTPSDSGVATALAALRVAAGRKGKVGSTRASSSIGRGSSRAAGLFPVGGRSGSATGLLPFGRGSSPPAGLLPFGHGSMAASGAAESSPIGFPFPPPAPPATSSPVPLATSSPATLLAKSPTPPPPTPLIAPPTNSTAPPPYTVPPWPPQVPGLGPPSPHGNLPQDPWLQFIFLLLLVGCFVVWASTKFLFLFSYPRVQVQHDGNNQIATR
ncbi:leucine-rich repeat extensin-like protein 5 isoform X2 [Miscanthus floridulus]|uniref:leucine-rich repeat extensin-like protein 5 isoform X2 n=1 Tax=Miscanthus floridulus TaxID=154761 RepID=UPI0034595A77